MRAAPAHVTRSIPKETEEANPWTWYQDNQNNEPELPRIIRIVRCATCREDRIVNPALEILTDVEKLVCQQCGNPVFERGKGK